MKEKVKPVPVWVVFLVCLVALFVCLAWLASKVATISDRNKAKTLRRNIQRLRERHRDKQELVNRFIRLAGEMEMNEELVGRTFEEAMLHHDSPKPYDAFQRALTECLSAGIARKDLMKITLHAAAQTSEAT